MTSDLTADSAGEGSQVSQSAAEAAKAAEAAGQPDTAQVSLPAPGDRIPGQSPDVLVHIGKRRVENVLLEVFAYDARHYRHQQAPSGADALQLLGETPAGATRWLRVTGLHDTTLIAEICESLGIHPLARGDILNTMHRPKIEQFENFLFVTLKLVGDALPASDEGLPSEQLSLVLMRDLVVSFHESPSRQFDPVLRRLERGNQRIRRLGADYLTWALLDVAVDHYFPLIDALEDQMESLEERLFAGDAKVTAREIFACRREAKELSHIVRPLRDLTSRLLRIDSPFLTDGTEPFFRDLSDHGRHLEEAVESLRESSVSLRDFHATALSNQLNEVMRFLASFSALFLPLTFLAGIYGMNFKFMPELELPWAYPVVWLVFALTATGMFRLFRRKNWI